MSLYLKYRPQKFEDIIDQSHITNILQHQVENGNNLNNYLFFGPRGTGKTTTARILAKAVNCLNPLKGDPCNQCDSCNLINSGKTIDIVEIDAASHTSVDNVRDEIIAKAPYPPSVLKKKVYIIDEVHMLSTSAFNALLKIMEEPPSYLMFILATTEMQKVPETILSRCQVFNFTLIVLNDMVNHLMEICKKENIAYDQEALQLIAKLSEGGMRDAIKYLDQISVMGTINQDNVSKFLGIATDRHVENMVDDMKKGDWSQSLKTIEALYQSGIDLSYFARQVLIYIDEHFLTDTSLLIKISEVFKNIISSIKNYPHPLIIFKIELYKYFHPEKEINETPSAKKVEVSIDGGTDHSNTGGSHEVGLIDQLLEKIDKASLKMGVKNFCIIDKIEGDMVDMIVINQMQYTLLNSQENISYMEEKLSVVLGRPVRLKMTYMSKGDYLAKQTGL